MSSLRIKNIVARIVSLALIGGGLALVGAFALGINPLVGEQSTATNSSDPDGFNVPELSGTQIASSRAAGGGNGPEDKTLTLNVPKMDQLDGVEIPDAAGDDVGALRSNAGIHLQGTGFPWQEEANVYMAGHRVGFPGTDSFLAFRDQRNLKAGDKIHVTDSEGIRYTYEVFSERVVGPGQTEVTQPVEGKNILTLQTCTFPNYSERIVTQAELVEKA